MAKIGEKELQRRAQREARAEGRKVVAVIDPALKASAERTLKRLAETEERDAVSPSPVSPAGPVAADPGAVPLEDAGLGDAMVSTRSRSKHRASMKEVMRKRRAKGIK